MSMELDPTEPQRCQEQIDTGAKVVQCQRAENHDGDHIAYVPAAGSGWAWARSLFEDLRVRP